MKPRPYLAGLYLVVAVVAAYGLITVLKTDSLLKGLFSMAATTYWVGSFIKEMLRGKDTA